MILDNLGGTFGGRDERGHGFSHLAGAGILEHGEVISLHHRQLYTALRIPAPACQRIKHPAGGLLRAAEQGNVARVGLRLVPVGGGLGRVFKLGDQPVSMYVSAYYNAIRPDAAPNWQLRAELSLLFPER